MQTTSFAKSTVRDGGVHIRTDNPSSQLMIPEMEKQTPIFEMKKIEEYLSHEFCLSCEFFQPVKGNFGRCTVLRKENRFDGTKKGSGCKIWRLAENLIQLTIPKETPKPKPLDNVFAEHNKRYKKKREITRKKAYPNYSLSHLGLVKTTKTRYTLPYAETSNIPRSRSLYGCRYPKHFVEKVLEVYKRTQSEYETSKYFSYKFGLNVSPSMVSKWREQFLGIKISEAQRKKSAKLFRLFNGDQLSECRYCKSSNIIQHGSRYNKTTIVQRFYCKDCKRDMTTAKGFANTKVDEKIMLKVLNFLDTDLSYRQISKELEKQCGVKVTAACLLNWNLKFKIRKYIPQKQRILESKERKRMDTQNKFAKKSERTQEKIILNMERNFRQFFSNEKRLGNFEGKMPHQKPLCPDCGSDKINRHGLRTNKFFTIQHFLCKNCNRKFTDRGNFSGMKYPQELVNYVIDLFNTSLSLRQIANDASKEFGIKISHGAVLNWARKFRTEKVFSKSGHMTEEQKQKISLGVREYYRRQQEKEIDALA